MGRLRDRLDRIENQASTTMLSAQDLIRLAKEFLAHVEEDVVVKIADGVELRFVKVNDGSLFDFVTAPAGTELPLGIRIVLK